MEIEKDGREREREGKEERVPMALTPRLIFSTFRQDTNLFCSAILFPNDVIR